MANGSVYRNVLGGGEGQVTAPNAILTGCISGGWRTPCLSGVSCLGACNGLGMPDASMDYEFLITVRKECYPAFFWQHLKKRIITLVSFGLCEVG